MTPADPVLALPRLGGVERQRRHETHHQAAQHRPDRPEPHRRGTADLGREIADQRRGGHQDDSLDEGDERVEHAEGELVGRVGNAEQRDEADQQQPVHDQVGAAEPVAEASQQGGEGADEIADRQDRDEIIERHLEVLEHEHRDTAADVELVVEGDGDRHDEQQMEAPGPLGRIGGQFAPVQPRRPRRHGSIGDRHGRSLGFSTLMERDRYSSNPALRRWILRRTAYQPFEKLRRRRRVR